MLRHYPPHFDPFLHLKSSNPSEDTKLAQIVLLYQALTLNTLDILFAPSRPKKYAVKHVLDKCKNPAAM